MYLFGRPDEEFVHAYLSRFNDRFWEHLRLPSATATPHPMS